MKVISNSPLQSVPDDYCPEGSEHWFKIPGAYDAGKILFYSDFVIGNHEPTSTILFVHGNPECSYTYRHIRDELINSQASARLIAMDHIGFGVSDKATFEMVDMHHAANLLQLVQYLDLQNITLVVHDWGGPIGIGALLEEPDRVCNLVVLNTTVFPMPDDGITYTNFPASWFPWSRTPKFVPDALWGGVAAYVVSHAEPQSTAKFLASVAWYMVLHAMKRFSNSSPEYVWSQMFRDKMNARSSKRNVLQTPYWGKGYAYNEPSHGRQDNHTFYEKINKALPVVWGPDGQNIQVCGYFGQWDACGKSSVINQWHEALPQMQGNTNTYPEVGHFIEEYKGPEIAASILGLLEKKVE